MSTLTELWPLGFLPQQGKDSMLPLDGCLSYVAHWLGVSSPQCVEENDENSDRT